MCTAPGSRCRACTRAEKAVRKRSSSLAATIAHTSCAHAGEAVTALGQELHSPCRHRHPSSPHCCMVKGQYRQVTWGYCSLSLHHDLNSLLCGMDGSIWNRLKTNSGGQLLTQRCMRSRLTPQVR